MAEMKRAPTHSSQLLARFVGALEALAARPHGGQVTKCDFDELRRDIMESIVNFGNRVNAAFDKIGAAVDGILTDVIWLKAEIVRFQSTPGALTPEDQAILDALEVRATAVVTKAENLDAATETPPTPNP